MLILVCEFRLNLWQERDSLEHKLLLYSVACWCQEVIKRIRMMAIKWMEHSFLSMQNFTGEMDLDASL